MKKPLRHYFNYVEYARKLQAMSNEELQLEMDAKRVVLRMVEQELRFRRSNQKQLNLAKKWKEEKDGSDSRTEQ